MFKRRIVSFSLLWVMLNSHATSVTQRIPQFANNQVNVWETVIYPSEKQVLKTHRHDHNRVLVAFDEGVLQVVNNKGKVKYLHLAKNKSYFLSKDPRGEVHTDENMSHHPIRVLVIELR